MDDPGSGPQAGFGCPVMICFVEHFIKIVAEERTGVKKGYASFCQSLPESVGGRVSLAGDSEMLQFFIAEWLAG